MLAQASCFVAFNSLLRGDSTAAQKRAEETMALIEVFGFPSFLAMTITVNGAALIAQGRYEEGIAGMAPGHLRYSRYRGDPSSYGIFYLLASGLGRMGRPQEGLQVLEEGFASSREV